MSILRGLAGPNYCRVILTAQSLYTDLNYPEIPDSWINFIYLHINHLHNLNGVLISIHQLTTQREINMSTSISFTDMGNGLFKTNSIARGSVKKEYINKNYNLGGEVLGSFTLLKKSFFTEQRVNKVGFAG